MPCLFRSCHTRFPFHGCQSTLLFCSSIDIEKVAMLFPLPSVVRCRWPLFCSITRSCRLFFSSCRSYPSEIGLLYTKSEIDVCVSIPSCPSESSSTTRLFLPFIVCTHIFFALKSRRRKRHVRRPEMNRATSSEAVAVEARLQISIQHRLWSTVPLVRMPPIL